MTAARADFSFRAATSADADAMRDLHVAAIMAVDEGAYALPLRESWAHGLRANRYIAAMDDGEDFEIVVDPNGGVAAFCGVKNGEILGLYVHPCAQRAGLGSALLTRGEARARRQRPGADHLRLTASLNAVPFYRKHGYDLIEIAERPSRGGLPMKAAKMRKPLRVPDIQHS